MSSTSSSLASSSPCSVGTSREDDSVDSVLMINATTEAEDGECWGLIPLDAGTAFAFSAVWSVSLLLFTGYSFPSFYTVMETIERKNAHNNRALIQQRGVMKSEQVLHISNPFVSHVIAERNEEEENGRHEGVTYALSYHWSSVCKSLRCGDTESEEETKL